MKTYTIIGGINGVGKSSLLGVLKSIYNLGRIVDVERFMTNENGLNINACKQAVRIIDESMEAGISFCQETCLTGYKTVKTVKKAVEMGYDIDLYYVGVDSFSECNHRIVNRVVRGGLSIDRDIVERRFGVKFVTLFKILKYCKKVVFYDNQNGFTEVAQFKNSEIIPIGSYQPDWVKEMIKEYTD